MPSINEMPVKDMEAGHTRYVLLSALIGLTKDGEVIADHVGLDNNALGRLQANRQHCVRVTKLSGGITVYLTRSEFNTLLNPSSYQGGPHLKVKLIIQ